MIIQEGVKSDSRTRGCGSTRLASERRGQSEESERVSGREFRTRGSAAGSTTPFTVIRAARRVSGVKPEAEARRRTAGPTYSRREGGERRERARSGNPRCWLALRPSPGRSSTLPVSLASPLSLSCASLVHLCAVLSAGSQESTASAPNAGTRVKSSRSSFDGESCRLKIYIITKNQKKKFI